MIKSGKKTKIKKAIGWGLILFGILIGLTPIFEYFYPDNDLFLINSSKTQQQLSGEMTTKTTIFTKPKETGVMKEGACESLKKVANTKVQAFLVSYCPFGLQMQRIIVNLPDELRSNVDIKYIGSVVNGKITAMHGEREAQENLRQICIREEQADKFYLYLECFIRAGEMETCLTEVGMDMIMLDTCMETNGIEYAKADFESQNNYGIRGSPTLIVNGNNVSEFDFGGRNVNALKEIICCSSTNSSSLCLQELDKSAVVRGFAK